MYSLHSDYIHSPSLYVENFKYIHIRISYRYYYGYDYEDNLEYVNIFYVIIPVFVFVVFAYVYSDYIKGNTDLRPEQSREQTHVLKILENPNLYTEKWGLQGNTVSSWL